MNSDLPEYRPHRTSGGFAPIPVSKEFCQTLLARWKRSATEIEKAVSIFNQQGADPALTDNLLNVAGAYRNCARELSLVMQGCGAPPAGFDWPESREET